MRIRLAVLFALLGVICVALPLHIAMTGVCFLALAAVLTALHLLRGHRRERLWRAVLIALSCVCAAAVIGGTGYVIASGRSDVPDAADAPEFVVVLGAQIHGGQPSRTLRERLDLAREYLLAHPDAVCIVSGGQGSDELQTEASVMKAWLVRSGIGEARIIEETEASNTRQNLIFSERLAAQMGADTSRVLIITSEFHLCRAKYLARRLGMEPRGLGSRTTPWILMVNYAVREVFAFGKAMLIP